MPLGSNPIFVPRCCNAIIAILIVGALLLVDSSLVAPSLVASAIAAEELRMIEGISLRGSETNHQ